MWGSGAAADMALGVTTGVYWRTLPASIGRGQGSPPSQARPVAGLASSARGDGEQLECTRLAAASKPWCLRVAVGQLRRRRRYSEQLWSEPCLRQSFRRMTVGAKGSAQRQPDTPPPRQPAQRRLLGWEEMRYRYDIDAMDTWNRRRTEGNH